MNVKNFFWLIFLSVICIGCQSDEIIDGVIDEGAEGLTQVELKRMHDFFEIDTALLLRLQQDDDFVSLCDSYIETRALMLEQNDSIFWRVANKRWLRILDKAIDIYEVENIFAYVLFSVQEKNVESRISHEWGYCYYHEMGDPYVCDTYGNWLDLWHYWGSIERNVISVVGDGFDLWAFRNSYFDYLFSVYWPVSGYYYEEFLFMNLVDPYTSPLESFMSMRLEEVVDGILRVGVHDDLVCAFVGEWSTINTDFYNSGLWRKTQDMTSEGESGGGADVPSYVDDILYDVSMDDYEYIDCAYWAVALRSSFYRSLVADFIKENSLVDLNYTVVENLPENVNGRLVGEIKDNTLLIELSSKLNEMPPLLVAKTIIHETIHAYITMELLKIQDTWCKENLDKEEFAKLSEALNERNYPTLYAYYNLYKSRGKSQHEYMAKYYVSKIASALFEISEVSYTICLAVAWQGLNYVQTTEGVVEATQAWLDLDENTRNNYNALYKDYKQTIDVGCFD